MDSVLEACAGGNTWWRHANNHRRCGSVCSHAGWLARTEYGSRGLRSPRAKATMWRVRRHIAAHIHRLCSFFCTQLQMSSNSSTSSGAHLLNTLALA